MGNKFEIRVQAIDGATAVFRKVNNEMSKVMRPVTTAQRQFVALSREMHLDKITKGMSSLSHASMKVASSLGLAKEPMEALFGLGAAGGIVAAASGVAGLTGRWANMGFEVARSAEAIGVSTDELQRFRGAAKLAGVSAETMDATLQGLAKTLEDAAFKRDPEAREVMSHLGISMKTLANGAPDTASALHDIADAMSKVGSPQTRAVLANALHIPADVIPLLMKGGAAMDALAAHAEKLGLVLSSKQIEDAKNYAESIRELDAAATGLTNTLGRLTAPTLTRSMTKVTSMLTTKTSIWDFLNLLDEGAGLSATGGGVALSESSRRRIAAGALATAPGGGASPGVRGNNWGNLRNPGGSGFQSFASSQDGLNAMASQLWRYQNDPRWGGAKSLRNIIGTYAPAGDNNDVPAYIADVSRRSGISPDAVPDANDPRVLAPLLSAMARHEQGRDAPAEQVAAAAAQAINVHVSFDNAPPGTRVKAADAAGAYVPTRVSYTMPTTLTP